MASVTEIQRMDNCRPGITPDPPFTLGAAVTPWQVDAQLSRAALEIERILDMCVRLQPRAAKGSNRVIAELAVSTTSRANDESAELAASETLRQLVCSEVEAALQQVRTNWEDSWHFDSIGLALDELDTRLDERLVRFARRIAVNVLRAYQREIVTPTRLDRAIARDPMMPEGDAR